jgi:hypothetical protein
MAGGAGGQPAAMTTNASFAKKKLSRVGCNPTIPHAHQLKGKLKWGKPFGFHEFAKKS